MEAKSKRRRQARSASEWQALLAQFKTSGLSSAAFCRHHDIGDRPFHRWRTHLSHQEETPSDPASAAPAFVDLGPLTAESPRCQSALNFYQNAAVFSVRYLPHLM